MCKKGFISSYFLYNLIVISIFIATLLLSIQLKTKSLYNLNISNDYLLQEIIVINDIKCKLLNNEIFEGVYSIEDLSYEITQHEETLYVNINSNLNESLIIYLIKKEDNYEIKDYYSSAYKSLGL